MGRNKKLAKNIGFVFVGNIGSKLVGFFMLPSKVSQVIIHKRDLT